MSGSKLSRCCVGDRDGHDIRVDIEIDLISVMGSNSSWFLCPGSNEIDLVLVRGSKLTSFS